MNTYDKLKKRLIQLNTDFVNLFNDTESFSGMSRAHVNKYEQTCNTISKQLTEDIVRVAVVGPIKSGKSTFVNSLFRHDYLKRGAGVVTSIVTKIHCGQNLKATVTFKSWDEINHDIEQGLTLLPIENQETEELRFDLRKEDHRQKLQDGIGSLKSDQLIIDDSRNLNIVLLSSYLKGYEQVKDIIAPDTVTKIYGNEKFTEHRTYSGDEVMAVYINDIQLEINSDLWDGSIEIADCQGSDSPNPLHLAMVQDYLSITNLIVYVISSRTGLRRADIKFLSMIKEMGIMDNMLFVVNCDFSEHESMADFNKLMEKIKEELLIFMPEPELFTLSALYNLFSAKNNSEGLNTELTEKDILRLQQWENEKEFSKLSTTESERFEGVLKRRLTEDRYSLLLTNHIERLSLMASGINQMITVNKEIINRDSSSAKEIINRIKGNQSKTTKVSAMIRNTLDGAVKQVNADLKKEVETYFDERGGTAISDIKTFIRNYEHNFNNYTSDPETSNFTANLYIVFQEFKQTVDTFMAETIAPRILGFIKTNDSMLLETLDQMTKPYSNMVQNALAEYSSVLDEFQISIEIPDENNTGRELPDIETIKRAGNISYPKATAVISYSARVRAESVLKFGFYRIISFIKKTFKKGSGDKTKNEIIALKDGLSRIKYETVANLTSHFISYKENIKFQYFYKLTEMVANSIYDINTESFNAYVSDLETVSDLINEKKTDKEKIIQQLDSFKIEVKSLSSRAVEIRKDISAM